MRSLAASSPACIDICWKPDLGEEEWNVVVGGGGDDLLHAQG